jgi:hypothetical protein
MSYDILCYAGAATTTGCKQEGMNTSPVLENRQWHTGTKSIHDKNQVLLQVLRQSIFLTQSHHV